MSPEIVEKIKIHVFDSVKFFFRKSCHLLNNVEKSWRTADVHNLNMTFAKFCPH